MTDPFRANMLDGVAQATGTAVTPGTVGNVTFDVTHGAYGNTFASVVVELEGAILAGRRSS